LAVSELLELTALTDGGATRLAVFSGSATVGALSCER